MTTCEPIVLSPEAQCLVIDHIQGALPGEAVGLLAGSAEGKVELVLPLPNISKDIYFFLADPFEQYLALRRIKSEGLRLLAIYHSHPDGGGSASALDLKYAHAWECWHLIVPVDAKRGVPKSLEAFRCLREGGTECESVTLR